jgi:hypothetical protein
VGSPLKIGGREMKVKNMLEFIKFPEGVKVEDVDLTALETEWNRQYNGMKVSITEEVTQKVTDETKQGLLKQYGFENEEAIKTLVDSTKDKAQLENEALQNMQTELESLKSNLAEKDAKLLNSERLSYLGTFKTDKGLGLNPERINKAHKLILSEVSDEKDYETAAKEFVDTTPEWLTGGSKPRVNMGDDSTNTGEVKDQDAKDLESAWD